MATVTFVNQYHYTFHLINGIEFDIDGDTVTVSNGFVSIMATISGGTTQTLVGAVPVPNILYATVRSN